MLDGIELIWAEEVAGVEFDCVVKDGVWEERGVRRWVWLRDELSRHYRREALLGSFEAAEGRII